MLIALGVILLVFSLFLIASVLMQHGKAKNISGAIAGGAETFFGKTKGSTIDKMLSKVTSVVAVVFVVIVIVVYAMQDTALENLKDFEDALNTPVKDTTTSAVDKSEGTKDEGTKNEEGTASDTEAGTGTSADTEANTEVSTDASSADAE
ncbi:MAG: preprotein translocase subunit SecG [Clostridia bacterium]|nr:preprotein translocase subunit SecG [Clostridia bacterium]